MANIRLDPSKDQQVTQSSIDSIIFAILEKLRNAKIYYELAATRDDHVMIGVAVPGERWEIEVSKTGEVEVERFKSDGDIADAVAIDELVEKFSD